MEHSDKGHKKQCLKTNRDVIEEYVRTTSPPSLFLSCIRFIADHIHSVDDLVGFPEVVGKQLFREVEFFNKLRTLDASSVRVLELFMTAYGGAVLSSLNLSSCHLIVHEVTNFPFIFENLEELDLTSCKIGDDNEILMNFHRLKKLKWLSLVDNALTDDGLQKMTMSIRVFKHNLNELHYLDLSCNPGITSKSMKYLVCLNKLQFLDLSGNTVKKDGIAVLQSKSNLKLSKSRVKELDNKRHITNIGWAAEALHRWTQMDSNAHKTPSDATVNKSANKFYRKSNDQTKIAKCALKITCPSAEPRLQLISKDATDSSVLNVRNISENTTRCPSTATSTRKSAIDLRKDKNAIDDNEENKTHLNEMQQLMASYLDPSSHKQDTSSLWDAMNSASW